MIGLLAKLNILFPLIKQLVSKSTVHKDMKDRLYFIDKCLYEKVSSVMKWHADIKHIRGGESTKRKFLEGKV